MEETKRPTTSSPETRLALVAIAGGFAVAGLEFARLIFRNSQLFYPEREPVISWDPADYGIDPAAVQELEIVSLDGTKLHGWYCRAETPVASLLYCHGNSGNITISAPTFPYLLRNGISVLTFDYRGFGKSEGRTTVRGVLRDALAAAQLHDNLRPKDKPSILYGFSLGGAIAAQLAMRHNFDALVLQSTFTNLRDITSVLFPKLPLHLLSGNVFNTIKAIRRLTIPLLVIHGDKDDVIPHSMGERIYKGCESATEFLVVPGATHRDAYERGGQKIVDAMRRLISTCSIAKPLQFPTQVAS